MEHFGGIYEALKGHQNLLNNAVVEVVLSAFGVLSMKTELKHQWFNGHCTKLEYQAIILHTQIKPLQPCYN